MVPPAIIALAAVATVATIGGTVASVRASNAQQKAEKRARSTERRTAAIENARRIRQAVAERRIRQAEIESAAENQGAGLDSSSISGAISGLTGDTASNIGNARVQVAGNQRAADFRFQGARQAARFNSIASGFSALASLSTSAIATAGSFGGTQQPTSAG